MSQLTPAPLSVGFESRRGFVIGLIAGSIGRFAWGATDVTSPNAVVTVRSAEIGQQWRYAKHDYFTGALVDTEVDRVVAAGKMVEVAQELALKPRRPVIYPSWGPDWLHQSIGESGSAERSLSEVHNPWGMLVVDPHWPDLQAYQKPIPLWPLQMRSGWSTTLNTQYKIPGSDETMPWQLTMKVGRWESIVVPAGQFKALRYSNLINFRYTNVSGRVAGQRKETIWLVPEIGRWAARESSGTFRQDVAEEFNEDSYRWELLDWI